MATVKQLLGIKRQQISWDHQHHLKHSRIQSSPESAFCPSPSDPSPCGPSPSDSDPSPSAPSDPSPPSLFHWQVKQQQQKVKLLTVEQLLQQDDDGDTFLHVSVSQGKRSLSFALAELMSRCGSLDLKEHNGQTALHIAAACGHHLILGDLLHHGSSLEVKDRWGRTALHVSAGRGHRDSLESVLKFVKETGRKIDADVLNYDGLTALHVAVLAHNAVLKETETLVDPCSFMLRQQEAKRLRFLHCVHLLLLLGASCKTVEVKTGRTVLHMASESGNFQLLHLLLQSPTATGVVNFKTLSGNTPLHLLCSLRGPAPCPSPASVRLLLSAGAETQTTNLENQSPEQLVAPGPRGDQLRHLLRGQQVD